MNMLLTCSHCHEKVNYEICHRKYGWCLLCHGMVPCANCGSFLKGIDYEALESFKKGLTGHEHRCRVEYSRELAILEHQQKKTPLVLRIFEFGIPVVGLMGWGVLFGLLLCNFI